MKRMVIAAVMLAGAATAHGAPVDDPTMMSMRPRDYVLHPENLVARESRFGPGPKHRIMYINRFGGKYNAAQDDDPAANDSEIVLSGGHTFVQVAPLSISEAAWAVEMACVRRVFAPFAIEITEEEPAPNVDYIEVVVGGIAGEIYSPDAGGVSSGADPGCMTKERAVDWVFEAGNAGDEWYCSTIAQESAHSFGLDHEFNCLDPMTYLPYCGPYEFLDQDVPCGESGPRQCGCAGAPTQNSHDIFMKLLGPSDDVPPTAMFTSIADQGSISPSLEVSAEAMDDVRIDRVEWLLDGVVFSKSVVPPFTATIPTGVALGEHQLEVRAVDGDENPGGQTITVVAVPQCTAPADCGAGDWQCVDGACLGSVGNDCELHGQCASSLCLKAGGDSFCSVDCAGDSECPDGFQCKVPGEFGGKKCVPESGDGGGCAVAAGGRGQGLGLWLAGLGLVFLVARRRRVMIGR